eukprot:1696452-Pleurochrysis_carterae.AAC.1
MPHHHFRVEMVVECQGLAMTAMMAECRRASAQMGLGYEGHDSHVRTRQNRKSVTDAGLCAKGSRR